jgi:hypothetical protein
MTVVPIAVSSLANASKQAAHGAKRSGYQNRWHSMLHLVRLCRRVRDTCRAGLVWLPLVGSI